LPQQPEKTKTGTNAQPGILSRIFGSDAMTPEMEQAISIAQKENPNLAPIKTYGPLSRLLMGNAQGYTSPARNIYLNPAQLQGFTPQDIADTITHEQEHVNQMRARGGNPLTELYRESTTGRTPYGQRPDEMAAFQAEQERRARMGRQQTARPSFSNPEQDYVPMDRNLPFEKKR
jgi:hypothetical protein